MLPYRSREARATPRDAIPGTSATTADEQRASQAEAKYAGWHAWVARNGTKAATRSPAVRPPEPQDWEDLERQLAEQAQLDAAQDAT